MNDAGTTSGSETHWSSSINDALAKKPPAQQWPPGEKSKRATEKE
jgi:hypothetical protein